MEYITDNNKCTGCGVCVHVCPTSAVSMMLDEEGFYYPNIDKKKCIDCKKCKSYCHCEKEKQQYHMANSEYFAATANEDKDVYKASSGGVFFCIAKYVIDNGGVVFGARQDGVNEVYHTRAETIEELYYFRKSKYLQSKTEAVWTQVKSDLNNDRIVLFSGVACQIAALYSFLTKDYDNLITVEVICHGVPSYKVFKQYIAETEKAYNDKVVSVCYRDKRYGWKSNSICLQMQKSEIVNYSGANPLHGAYVKGYFNRKSCGQCAYSGLDRQSDFILADFWKYKGEVFESKKGLGISIMICRTEKSLIIKDELKSELLTEIASESSITNSCRHLLHTPKENERELFFDLFNKYGFFLSLYLIKYRSICAKIIMRIVPHRLLIYILAKHQTGVKMKLKTKYHFLFEKAHKIIKKAKWVL